MPAQFPALESTDTVQESSVLDLPHEDLGEVRKIIRFSKVYLIKYVSCSSTNSWCTFFAYSNRPYLLNFSDRLEKFIDFSQPLLNSTYRYSVHFSLC